MNKELFCPPIARYFSDGARANLEQLLGMIRSEEVRVVRVYIVFKSVITIW